MSEPPSDVKRALEMTGCKSVDDLIDMANVGSSLMEAIAIMAAQDGPMKDWTPAEDPAEIVVDLLNRAEEAETAVRNLAAAANNFRMLFVADSEPPNLTLEVDPNELANAFAELSAAIAAAKAFS